MASLSLFEVTYSVSELCAEVKEVLVAAFPSVWVVGEVQRARTSERGHLYFELVEKGERDEIVGKLEAVLWKTDHQRVARLLAGSGQRLADGLQVRCRGDLDFFAAGGRVQLCVREVDPAFTLGQLERRRRETLAALAAAGLLERNRGLPLPELPLRVALVTSAGSAAYHDFLSGLAESGYGFRVVFVHAAVQGREAEREVVSALAALARARVDCAVLVRGGGARTDLAAFDSRSIAEAVARAPFPVLTGLGHEIDQAIADLVAHTALKTPTKAAEFLVERVARAEQAVVELRRRLRREALEPLRAVREAIGRAERGVELARLRLAARAARLGEAARALARLGRSGVRAAGRRWQALSARLVELAPQRLEQAGAARAKAGRRLAAGARARLREAGARLDGHARLCAELGPERTLARGFSITRSGGGVLLRDAARVAPGEVLLTRLAAGTLTSRVEEG
jgi:exodeoxyribonuclease VII large subunit